ncbi:hypothetical protein [Bacillus sp. JJ1474]|uniref:hypothetical protein n=1 Tax=Bacillus sp. JJ1474 TaxID=3122955 RepID=UPI002FFE4C82
MRSIVLDGFENDDIQIDKEIVHQMSVEEKDEVIKNIITLHNIITHPDTRFDDSHHDVANDIYKIIIKREYPLLDGEKFL